jgi:tRNA(Ile)-lysidine synthase
MSPSLEATFAHLWPPSDWADLTVLVAVSGGADSVALLRLLASSRPAEAAGRLIAAHFNHRLRPDADDDQRWVSTLCRELGIDCVTGTAELGQRGGEGLEAAARRARYAFLRHSAEAAGARYVAVAHTADDQAETILHRLLRGTGLAGLGGMRRARPLGPAVSLVRPLLHIRRAALREYLKSLDQPWREDTTNADVRRTRARIRHALLPQLARDYNPRVVEALVRLGSQAAAAARVIDSWAEQLADECVTIRGTGHDVLVNIHTRLLAGTPRHLVCALFAHLWRTVGWPQQAMGHKEWNRLAALVESPAAVPITLPGHVHAERRGDFVTLRRSVTPPLARGRRR